LFVVVAVALVKIAFFPDVTTEANPAVPGAVLVEPVVAVAVGTVQNDVSLTGTVEASPAVPVAATLSGEVTKVYVAQGDSVEEGQSVVQLRGEGVNANGEPFTRWATVTAARSGVVSSLSALPGQQFSVGDPVGQIAPPTFTVTGSIPPEQLYRLLAQPSEAQVTINGGPAPFTCPQLTISAPIAGADGQNGAGAGPSVRCTVPGEVRVFAGLSAEIVIAGGIAENVLTIPMTAVEGVAETGNVYLSLPDGSSEIRAVKLGLNDGIMVEVLEGLEEGDLILQFVPGAPSTEDTFGDCFIDEFGNEICGG
jgi:macrolide-specific efflux system membrane fusion protein